MEEARRQKGVLPGNYPVDPVAQKRPDLDKTRSLLQLILILCRISFPIIHPRVHVRLSHLF